jgi:uncharacterized protein YigA (DUF484 family)
MDLAAKNLEEAGIYEQPTMAVQLKAVSLAYVQQREIVLMLQITEETTRYANENEVTFPEAMYRLAQMGAHENVQRDLKEMHKLSVQYKKELLQEKDGASD